MEYAQVIGMFRYPGITIGNPDATLPVLFPGAAGGHERIVRRAHRRERSAERFWHRLAGELIQARFAVKQVKVARPAFHEKPDDGLGRGRAMRRLWAERIDRLLPGRASEEAIQSQQITERQRPEAAAGAIKKLAARGHRQDVRDRSIHRWKIFATRI